MGGHLPLIAPYGLVPCFHLADFILQATGLFPVVNVTTDRLTPNQRPHRRKDHAHRSGYDACSSNLFQSTGPVFVSATATMPSPADRRGTEETITKPCLGDMHPSQVRFPMHRQTGRRDSARTEHGTLSWMMGSVLVHRIGIVKGHQHLGDWRPCLTPGGNTKSFCHNLRSTHWVPDP